MSETSFSMQLASPGSGRYSSLSFSSYIEGSSGLDDPIISSVCGREVDYGKLFAYCFRRFGYPNLGWDDYKELTRYLLTTSRDDLLLSIVPYVGDNSAITFSFFAPPKVDRAVSAYARRFRDAWARRAMDWREKQGLPDWMDEWVSYYNDEFLELLGSDAPQADSWREAIVSFPFGQPGSRIHDMTSRTADFHSQIHDDFAKVEPWPDYYCRPADWTTWDEDDPLKPYAEAAVGALRDLSRPVGVRDRVINAYGLVNDDEIEIESPVEAATVSGRPSGDLGNKAPEEFSELHHLVLKLGDGDAKLGIAIVMDAVGSLSEE